MAFQITVDQIEAIDDVETLRGLAADLEDQAGRIEADLEFRSDADADWEQRACAALGIARTRIKQIIRRINAIEGIPGGKSKKALIHESSQVAIEKAKIAAENSRLNAQASKRKMAVQMMSRIEQVSFTRCIVQVLREKMTKDEWADIIDQATALSEARAVEAIQSLAAE